MATKLSAGTPGVIPPVTLVQGTPALGQETITLDPEDADGNVQPLYSIPAYTVASADSTSPAFDGTIIPSSNGIQGIIQATGAAVGNYTVTVSAEADPTPGKNTLTATQVLTIAPAPAPAEDVTLNATTSGAQPIVAPTPAPVSK